MKRVWWAFGIVVALLGVGMGALWIAGSRAGANQVQARVDIERSAAAVWPYLEEPVKIKSWVGWMVEVRETSPGGRGLGSRQIWVMEDHNNGNQQMQMLSEVTAYRKGTAISLRASAPGGFSGDNAYTLEEVSAGHTRVTVRSDYRFENTFVRLMSPLVMSAVSKKMKEDLERLRVVVEKNETAGSRTSYFFLPWLATASIAALTFSGSPR